MGKKAAITGGSRGIGRGIVRKLASEGYDVAFTYSSDRGGQQARQLVEEVQSAYGVRCISQKVVVFSCFSLRTITL